MAVTVSYDWNFGTIYVYEDGVTNIISHSGSSSMYGVDYATIETIDSTWLDDVHNYCGSVYTFKEWNTAADGTGTAYDPGDKVYADTSLYAIWEGVAYSPKTLDFYTDENTLYKFNVLTNDERTKIAKALTVPSVLVYNKKDVSEWQEWVSGNSYVVGDRVKRTTASSVNGFICIQNTSKTYMTAGDWDIVTTFPPEGERDVLYIAMLENKAYYWDVDDEEYVCVGESAVIMTGATSSSAGTAGYAPAPSAGDQDKFLKGDGTWGEVNTSSSTVSKVSFTIATTDWTQSSNTYVADVTDSHITSTTEELIMYTNSVKNLTSDIDTNKDGANNKITFIVDSVPTGSISGSIYIISQGNIVADTKVDIDQGVENAGKFLVVNSQGNVEPVTMQAWQGGSY